MSEFRKTGLNILLIISIFYICNAAAEMHIGTNFWFLCSWTGEQPFKTGVDFSTTDDPWNPVFLDEIEIYSTLRFMDWMTTNWSGQSRWDQRTLKTDAIQEGRTNGGSQNQADGRTTWGVAYEWLIDLCNRNNSYIWVTIPHLTVSPSDLNQLSNDFSVKLAILMKHGIDMKDVDVLSMGDLSDKTAGELLAAGGVKTCDPLASHLKIYLEYSNETWNGMFAQSGYCNSKGMEMGLPGTPNEWYAGWAYHVYAAVRVWSAFERVFGEDDPRLMRVIAGQVGWGGGDVCRHQIVSLEDPAVNPDALNADAWAGAPYMGVNSVAELKSDIPNTIQMCKNNIQWIQSRDIKYINYEGGQHCINGADEVNRDPAIYQCYMEYLDSMATVVDDVFCHYAHCGAWGSGGAWGSKEYTGQPESEAHKYRALSDWVELNPKPVESNGIYRPLVGRTAPAPIGLTNQRAAARIVLLDGSSLRAGRDLSNASGFHICTSNHGIFLGRLNGQGPAYGLSPFPAD